MGAARLGKLDGDGADTARAGMDQHALAGLHPGGGDERLPCGDGDEGEGGGFDMADRGGFQGHFGRADRHVFGIAAVAADVGAGIDRVAGFEGGDACADLFDDPRHVPAEGEGQRVVQHLGQIAAPDFPIHRIDRGGDGADQQIVGADFGHRRVFDADHLRGAIVVDAGGFHLAVLSGGWTGEAMPGADGAIAPLTQG